MPGGCWVCNPICGKCKPPAKKAGSCNVCGFVTVFDKTDIVLKQSLCCKMCGADLSLLVVPAPVCCSYCGQWCAYPCGKGTGPEPKIGLQKCAHISRVAPPAPEC
jgi:hypothetical protein